MIVQRLVIDLIPVLADLAQNRPEFAGQLAMEFGRVGKPQRYKIRCRGWRILALRILLRREYCRQEASQRAVQCGEGRRRFAGAAGALQDVDCRSHSGGASSAGWRVENKRRGQGLQRSIDRLGLFVYHTDPSSATLLPPAPPQGDSLNVDHL